MGETIDRALAMSEIDQEALRDAMREAMREDRCSQGKMAARAGLGDSTFSGWLNGKYPGDNDKVANVVKTFLAGRRNQQVVRAATPAVTPFVMTASATAFIGMLQRAQYEPTMVTITGRPGVGKTEAAREYKRRNPGVWMLTATKSVSSPPAVLDYLCEVMGVAECNPARRSRAIRQALRAVDGLLIVDEAQHLKMHAIDELRAFHDDPDCRVGLALLGSPELRTQMLAGGARGQFAQLTSRFGAHIVRKTPLVPDVAALLDAEAITDPDARNLLRAVASEPGALREMKFILRAARMLAQDEDTSDITAEHITRAHNQRRAEIAEAA